jgi:hypothetical protein
MTADDRALVLARRISADARAFGSTDHLRLIAAAIREAEVAAAAKERGRCAKVAEGKCVHQSNTSILRVAAEIADEIRAPE